MIPLVLGLSKGKRVLIGILSLVNLKKRRNNEIKSFCLLRSVIQSPWYKLYHDGDDGSLIALISLNREAFNVLLDEFKLHYHFRSGPGKKGRPRRVRDYHTVLAIILHYYTSTMEYKSLCEMFGVTMSTLARIIEEGEAALSETLSNLPLAKVKWRIMTPSKESDLESVLVDMRPGLVRLSASTTAMRQAAEWGMDAIGQVYRLLQRKLHWNKDVRKQRLINIIKLYNFRVRTTGISQIKNYFDS